MTVGRHSARDHHDSSYYSGTAPSPARRGIVTRTAPGEPDGRAAHSESAAASESSPSRLGPAESCAMGLASRTIPPAPDISRYASGSEGLASPVSPGIFESRVLFPGHGGDAGDASVRARTVTVAPACSARELSTPLPPLPASPRCRQWGRWPASPRCRQWSHYGGVGLPPLPASRRCRPSATPGPGPGVSGASHWQPRRMPRLGRLSSRSSRRRSRASPFAAGAFGPRTRDRPADRRLGGRPHRGRTSPRGFPSESAHHGRRRRSPQTPL